MFSCIVQRRHVSRAASLDAGQAAPASYVHVGFVVGANLLDPDVVLGVNERLCGGVCLGESHNTGYVLELTVIVHLHLYTNTQEATGTLRHNFAERRVRPTRTFPIPEWACPIFTTTGKDGMLT